jgi:hypothetical protein
VALYFIQSGFGLVVGSQCDGQVYTSVTLPGFTGCSPQASRNSILWRERIVIHSCWFWVLLTGVVIVPERQYDFVYMLAAKGRGQACAASRPYE